MKNQVIENARKIADYHYASDQAGFYAQQIQYTNMLKNDFKRIVKKGMNIPTKSDLSDRLNNLGISQHKIRELRALRAFDQLRAKSKVIELPPEQNSINVELNAEEILLAWDIVKSEKTILEAIGKHLANEFVIQEAYYFIAENYKEQNKISTSGFWHRDSVGRRIKIFICLEKSNPSPKTAVLPCTYLDPIPREWEMARAVVPSGALHDERFKETEYVRNKLDQCNPVIAEYEEGIITLLDTNAIHRGIYEKNQSKLRERRTVLQVSLIPKTTLDLQVLLHKVCWAQKDVSYPDSHFEKMPLHTPPFNRNQD